MSSDYDNEDLEQSQTEVVFSDYVIRRGMRMTKARRRIAEAVTSMPMKFTVDELIAEADCHRATVYWTLHELVGAGLLEKRGFKYVKWGFG